MFKRGLFFDLYALVVALSTFSGVFRIGSTIYVILVFLFFLFTFVAGGKNLRVGLSAIALFLVICITSVLVNSPPSYFRVWERLAVFICTLLAFSPLLVSESLNRNRQLLFDGLNKVMLFFSVASFVGYFLGINFFVRNGELLDYTEAGHFSGFANHSMVLAPISAIGSIYALSKALTSNKKEKYCLYWWGGTLMCLGAVLLSASRGALGGVVLAMVVVVYRHSASHMGKFLRYGLVSIAMLAITFPLWGGLTDFVIEKNDYNISEGGFAYSREAKMAARFHEIKNNFLTGVGFSVVDETVDTVDHYTGTIEPNSSWLGVFSMTGIFGFIVFLGIFLHAFWTAYKKIVNREWAILLCGIMGFFFIHLMIEGYVLAGGNVLCGMYWLTIGTIYSFSRYNIRTVTK